MSNRIFFLTLDEMLYGQHRKGCTIHILTFKGIEGGYIYRTVLKLFKWTYSWFDIVGCSKY